MKSLPPVSRILSSLLMRQAYFEAPPVRPSLQQISPGPGTEIPRLAAPATSEVRCSLAVGNPTLTSPAALATPAVFCLAAAGSHNKIHHQLTPQLGGLHTDGGPVVPSGRFGELLLSPFCTKN